jgi:hypothetical protein
VWLRRGTRLRRGTAEPVDEVSHVRLVSPPIPLTKVARQRLVCLRVGTEFRAGRLPHVNHDVLAMRWPIPVLPRRKAPWLRRRRRCRCTRGAGHILRTAHRSARWCRPEPGRGST